jgi:eukaryotic-like serine/threonine-protein kinase
VSEGCLGAALLLLEGIEVPRTRGRLSHPKMSHLSVSPPLSSPAMLSPGTIIGNKYRIDGVLGAGGMGYVLAATHMQLGAQVAIKFVRDELARDEAIVSRLLFEAQAVARMRSAHIVRVLDVARLSSGAPYIVMEHLEGSDLAAVLAESGPLPVHDVVGYVLQTCEGLVEAHGFGIVHRDLKPENLFLAHTPEGIVLKILDFGISKDIGTTLRRGSRSSLTNGGAAIGSPSYMAPEQMRALANLDGRADIWSLGAILFELLTGRCPFEAESPPLLFSKVLVEEAPSLLDAMPDAPVELAAIVRRCLQKDPSARFQSVAELAQALRLFAGRAELARARSYSGIILNGAATATALHVSQTAFSEPVAPTRRSRVPRVLAWSVLLVAIGVGVWQRQTLAEAAQRLRPQRALAAELQKPATPSEVRVLDQTRTPAPVAAPTVSVTVSPGVSAVPAVEASPLTEDKPRLRAPPAPAPLLRVQPAPAPAPAPAPNHFVLQPAPGTPAGAAARYGL